MCKKGNQTIFRACREEMQRRGIRRNKDMREELRKNGGCVAADKETLDKRRTAVLAS